MFKFFEDNKGMVTVMVTLLLIPALLVSGTGVDLARIYTAKSIVQDANQLAANSVMTQYDAMLQDVFGLFGVAQSDEELNALVTEYVNRSIFGTADPAQLGSFQLFYGADTQTEVTREQNLAQIAVLRHQIEEYAKFRAPIVIADEIIQRLKAFDKVKTDSEVIQEKMDIDEEVRDLYEYYKKLYEEILEANECKEEQEAIVSSINARLTEIRAQLQKMIPIRDEYTDVYESKPLYWQEKLADCEAKYEICLNNIRSIISGSYVIYSWTEASINEEGEWVPVEKVYVKSGGDNLEEAVDNAVEMLEDQLEELEDVVEKCRQVDSAKTTLEAKLNALEAKLNSGQCSETLKTGMQEELAAYKALLTYNTTAMGEAMQSVDRAQINQLMEDLRNVVYGSIGEDNRVDPNNSLSLRALNELRYDPRFDVDLVIQNKNRQPANRYSESTLSYFAYLSNYKYAVPGTFFKFQDDVFDDTKNREFFEYLQDICNSADSKNVSKTKKNVAEFLEKLQKMFQQINFIPQGAGYYRVDSTGSGSDSFGQSGTWGDSDKIMDQMSDGLDQIKDIASAADAAVDKLLLVTYASEMFSCYTNVNTLVSDPAERQLSMSGVYLDTDVCYFYQSELEYLLHGDLNSAPGNLMAVSGTLLLVRFVFNYISTFTVDEVKNTIRAIKTTCNVGGPLGAVIGFAVGELARVGFALGESVIDVMRLRGGDPVPLLKKNDTWQLSLKNLAEEAMGEIMWDDHEAEPGDLTYRDYVRLFLLVKDTNTIAVRVRDLIEINMTSLKNNLYKAHTLIYGSEDAMSAAAQYELSKAGTAFTVKTSVDMRFLFLSMSYFQKGIDGVVPPKDADITAVDYRGY